MPENRLNQAIQLFQHMSNPRRRVFLWRGFVCSMPRQGSLGTNAKTVR